MNNMTRVSLLLLAVLFVISLCGCEPQGPKLEAGKDLNSKMPDQQKARLQKREQENNQ